MFGGRLWASRKGIAALPLKLWQPNSSKVAIPRAASRLLHECEMRAAAARRKIDMVRVCVNARVCVRACVRDLLGVVARFGI